MALPHWMYESRLHTYTLLIYVFLVQTKAKVAIHTPFSFGLHTKNAVGGVFFARTTFVQRVFMNGSGQIYHLQGQASADLGDTKMKTPE